MADGGMMRTDPHARTIARMRKRALPAAMTTTQNTANIVPTMDSSAAPINQEASKGGLYASTPQGKAITLATLLIPFGVVGFFIAYCQAKGGEYALEAMVDVTDALKVALIIHGAYFIVFEVSASEVR